MCATTKIRLHDNVSQLKEEIQHHNLLYYQKNKPEITDAEFDELKRRAAKIEKQFPEFSNLQDSVGAAPDQRFSKIKHVEPMLSLGIQTIFFWRN